MAVRKSSRKKSTQEIRRGREQERGERHAPGKARDPAFRQGRQGWEGHEPQTGDRHRAFGSAQEGRQSSDEEGQLEKSMESRCRGLNFAQAPLQKAALAVVGDQFKGARSSFSRLPPEIRGGAAGRRGQRAEGDSFPDRWLRPAPPPVRAPAGDHPP